MTKKNWLLLFLLLVLATVYAVWFTGWFTPKFIQITSTSRPAPGNNARSRRNGAEPAAIPPCFMLKSAYRLTEVKVVLLSAWQTNHDVMPLWHMISKANPQPVRLFYYGQDGYLAGMKPAVPGSHAESLEPDETYRIFVQAGSIKGQQDFLTRAAD